MPEAHDHFERLFGELELSSNDAAHWVFAAGWNSCIKELAHRLKDMPLEPDTRDSFAIYLQKMITNTQKDTMQ